MALSLSVAQMARIAVYAKAARFEPYIDAFNESLVKYQINARLRLAHYLAQWMEESGEFRYMTELASGKAYEGRRDLGNVEPGDGVRFKGRGLCQLTGRTAYRLYGEYEQVDFLAEPEMLAEQPYCIDVGGWFWTIYKHINTAADRDDLLTVTRLVNGGTNGLAARRNYLIRAKRVLVVSPISTRPVPG